MCFIGITWGTYWDCILDVHIKLAVGINKNYLVISVESYIFINNINIFSDFNQLN